jgi:alpha-beta hydrolase superfamily lysophospholipase
MIDSECWSVSEISRSDQFDLDLAAPPEQTVVPRDSTPMPGDTRFLSRQRIRRWLIFGAAVVALWLLASAFFVYRSTGRRRAPFAEPIPNVPWARFESHRITTGDGEQLGAWYASGKESSPTVLLLHGNGGSRWNSLQRAAIFATERGCAVLLVSLRAHGDSTGDINDIGLSARHDVVAAVEFLRQRRPGEPIIVHGVSLGAAAAVFAARELQGAVRGYILESPYRDLKTAVWNRTNANLPPGLSHLAYLGLRIAAPIAFPNFEAIAPVEAIGHIPSHVPILILTGSDDVLARPAEAFALYDRVRSHARVEVIEGADHHNLSQLSPSPYRQLILDFCAHVGRPKDQ